MGGWGVGGTGEIASDWGGGGRRRHLGSSGFGVPSSPDLEENAAAAAVRLAAWARGRDSAPGRAGWDSRWAAAASLAAGEGGTCRRAHQICIAGNILLSPQHAVDPLESHLRILG